MKNRSVIPSDNWATPPDLLGEITKQFGNYFDPCPWNHDVNKWDGLKIDWKEFNFVNPPFSTKLKTLFIEKAIDEHKKGNATLMLLPAATDTKSYHDLILPNQSLRETHIKGRPDFIGTNTKGQYVNYELIEDVDYNELIEYVNNNDLIELIPKHVKCNGQNSCMFVFFDGGQKITNLEKKISALQNYKYEKTTK